MRSLLKGIVLGVSVAVSAMPSGWADAIDAGQLWPSGALDAADDLWSEAGVCVVAPSRKVAGRPFEEYPVDLCACEPDADCDLGHGGGCDAEPCREDAVAGCCGVVDADRPSRRFYITGIIGASFGTLQSGGVNTEGDFFNTGRATDSLLTAGGAVGMAFDRTDGLLRLEVEGRGRDALQGQTNSFQPPTPTVF